MDFAVVAVTLYKNEIFYVRIGLDSRISEVKSIICTRWLDFTPTTSNLYVFREQKKTLIDTDSDLQSLACFVYAKGYGYVEMYVGMVEQPLRGSGSSSVTQMCDVSIAIQHPSKSSVWATLITGVGQRFRGGSVKFKTMLLKYCLENGFGEMCSNIAESFNYWIGKERYMPITSMLDTIRVKIMGMMTSCNMWTIESFPCEHALQCILSIGEDVHKFCDPYLAICAFRDSYSQSINHVLDIEKPKGKPEGSFILPPDTKRRRRNKRKESMGARERKLHKCSRCNLYGYHNRATCTAGQP
ncbi:hypothetical protein IFM89_007342 [Coptis chinensis]|uniref:Zinc finger PMZ-type domain-containing protein n=1 Tax=Coptis chinensis TaxID=261450 RepID=A0A835LGN4_9MAGN|nr:hypothetical protein IFM89_007342 [Coptis chinensis]